MADLAPTLPFKRASISIIPDFQDTVILTEYNLTDYIDKLNEMGWVDLRIENDLLQFSQLNSYG